MVNVGLYYIYIYIIPYMDPVHILRWKNGWGNTSCPLNDGPVEALVDFCSLVENLAPLETRAVFFLAVSWVSISSIFHMYISRWWFQIFFIFTPTWGRFPFWLIFFKGVGTTNQVCIYIYIFVNPFWSPLGYQLHRGNIAWRELRWLMTAHVFMFEHFYFSCFLEVPFFMFPVVWHGMKYQDIELPPLYLWVFGKNLAPPGI